MQLATLRQAAAKYRQDSEERGHSRKGGVVVLFNGQVAGWMDKLRDPQGWEPGCVALDDFGNAWEAIGGDSYNGAEDWIQIEQGEYAPLETWIEAAEQARADNPGWQLVFWCGGNHPGIEPGAAGGIHPPDPYKWPDGGALVDRNNVLFTVRSGQWSIVAFGNGVPF